MERGHTNTTPQLCLCMTESSMKPFMLIQTLQDSRVHGSSRPAYSSCSRSSMSEKFAYSSEYSYSTADSAFSLKLGVEELHSCLSSPNSFCSLVLTNSHWSAMPMHQIL